MIAKLADYGLSLDPTTGRIHGVPSFLGDVAFKIRATGPGGSREMLVNVNIDGTWDPWTVPDEGERVWPLGTDVASLRTDAAAVFPYLNAGESAYHIGSELDITGDFTIAGWFYDDQNRSN